jgi:hypothetical protein
MNDPFVGGVDGPHDGRGSGIAQAPWPAQPGALPCDLPDDHWPEDLDQEGLDQQMADAVAEGLLRVRALLALCLIGWTFGAAMVWIVGKLAGWL